MQKSHHIDKQCDSCWSDTLYYEAALLSGCVLTDAINEHQAQDLIAGRNSLSLLFEENHFWKCCSCLWTQSMDMVFLFIYLYKYIQIPREFRVKNTFKFSLHSHLLFIFSFIGNPPSAIVPHRPTARQKHYATTEPFQLVGEDWKPISQLQSQVANSS